MKRKFALYICFIINVVLLFYIVGCFAKLSQSIFNECQERTVLSFSRAIYNEAYKRISDNDILYLQSNGGEERPEQETLISATDTIRLNRTEEREKRTEEEKSLAVFQTVSVWEEVYLQIDDLNMLWNKDLEDKNILLETGVKYRHRDFADTEYSNQDSLFFLNALRTPEHITGLFEEITLQGYYKITFNTLLNYSGKDLLFYFFGCLFFTITLIIICFFLIKTSIIRLNHLVKPEQEEPKKFRKVECIYLNEDLLVDVERGLLRSRDGREASLRPMMIKLLQVFTDSPNLYASNQLLWKEIWEREEDTSNVLTQLIRNFKNETKIFPEITIKSKNKGYELIINSIVPTPESPDPDLKTDNTQTPISDPPLIQEGV